jgi:hypothetical protein
MGNLTTWLQTQSESNEQQQLWKFLADQGEESTGET